MHREVYALLYSDKKQVLESQTPQVLVPDQSACPVSWFSLLVLSLPPSSVWAPAFLVGCRRSSDLSF